MTTGTTLLYIADPMCSWCWGFRTQLRLIEEALPNLSVQLVLGGLAPDSEEPMPEEMRAYVQQAWDAVEETTGAAFDRGFWDGRNPDIRRSTYPSCRAVVLARREGKEHAMFDAIQHAYYQEAKNPSNAAVLADCATSVGLGMSREDFLLALDAEETQRELERDFELRRELGANTFPSLALAGSPIPDPGVVFHRGWGTAEELLPRIAELL